MHRPETEIERKEKIVYKKYSKQVKSMKTNA
jgi:hypothetical protein